MTNQEETKGARIMNYYVIESENVGPNLDDRKNSHIVTITTEPGRTNGSDHHVLIDGWLGTTCDNAQYANGVYASIEAAREKISELWPETRDVDEEHLDDGDVEAYYVGLYDQWGSQATEDWAYEAVRRGMSVGDVMADGKDEADAELDRDTLERMVAERTEGI